MPTPFSPLPPGAWLGLFGGGQLGRMFCFAAQSLGYRVCVLDPGADSPAGAVADRHIQADYLDPNALDTLAALCQAATTEFENVPAAALESLSGRIRVAPGAKAVAIAQDRIAEKAFFSGLGLAVAPYAVVRAEDDLNALPPTLWPGILKAARLGYDGKGQARVASLDAAREAFRALGGVPCVLEQQLPLAGEVSVVVARGADGQTSAWPVAENVHRQGILAVSTVPARVAPEMASAATEATLRMAEALDYVGVLCVEFFLLADGSLRVNEMAPRPHNSGHYSIDACITSQFEQQARALAGLPLGATRQHTPAVMLNLLGDLWWPKGSGPMEPDWSVVLEAPQAKLHLYGKSEARPGRKMGHVTVLAESQPAAIETAARIERALGIVQ